jgi:hypothetical protein
MNKKIAETAEKYLGFTEIPQNRGFSDATFQKKMEAVGWKKGEAWCTYFGELVCKEAMPELTNLFNRLFSGSATETWKNFDIAKMTTQTPEVGMLAVFRFGNGWKGHFGIVTKVFSENSFMLVEGNTNNGGSREGFAVCQKDRKKTPYTAKGLNLIGFIDIPEI